MINLTKSNKRGGDESTWKRIQNNDSKNDPKIWKQNGDTDILSLVDSMYRSLFWVLSASLCLFIGAFNPFTFKVIIDNYDPVAIYFVLLGLSL